MKITYPSGVAVVLAISVMAGCGKRGTPPRVVAPPAETPATPSGSAPNGVAPQSASGTPAGATPAMADDPIARRAGVAPKVKRIDPAERTPEKRKAFLDDLRKKRGLK